MQIIHSRPLLRTMQQAQQLNPQTLDPVHHYERRMADHQFSRARPARGAPQPGMLEQRLHLCTDAVTLAHGGEGVVLGDVIQLGIAIQDGAL